MSILALHGFTGRGADFAPFAEICGNSWRTPDLPGHGPAPQLDCSPAACVAQIQQARSEPPQATILLGYSFGARAALLHALAHPSAWHALILISATAGIESERERSCRAQADEQLAQRIEQHGVADFIQFWQNTPMILSQQNICSAWRQTMQQNRQAHSALGLATSLRQLGQGKCPNLWPRLCELTMPVLLISGEKDLKYCSIAQRMQAALPNADRVSIPQAGHMPHLERPAATAAAINNFLARLSKTAHKP